MNKHPVPLSSIAPVVHSASSHLQQWGQVLSHPDSSMGIWVGCSSCLPMAMVANKEVLACDCTTQHKHDHGWHPHAHPGHCCELLLVGWITGWWVAGVRLWPQYHNGEQPSICPQPCEPLLTGWITGASCQWWGNGEQWCKGWRDKEGMGNKDTRGKGTTREQGTGTQGPKGWPGNGEQGQNNNDNDEGDGDRNNNDNGNGNGDGDGDGGFFLFLSSKFCILVVCKTHPRCLITYWKVSYKWMKI